MQPQEVDRTAAEAGKVLDTLAALSLELACRCDVAPEQLVLDAATLKDACAAIDDAVSSLKRILAIADAQRTGPARRDPAR
jgi:hypothetical protein